MVNKNLQTLTTLMSRVFYYKRAALKPYTFDSHVFDNEMIYEIKDGSLLAYTRRNGIIAIPVNRLGEWADELKQLAEDMTNDH